jgi:hypothetical protein
MNKSESIANLALALSKAQLELSNPKKTSSNPFFKSKYADLSEVINVSKTVLAEHGLSIMQFLSYTDMVNVETMILHSTGEWISETLSLPVAKHDAQSIGSTCTYARRYSWAAICGLAQEDDDANAAVEHKPEAQKQAATNKEPDYAAMLNSAKSLPELSKIWNASIPDDQRDKYRAIANEIKLRFPKMEAVA